MANPSGTIPVIFFGGALGGSHTRYCSYTCFGEIGAGRCSGTALTSARGLSVLKNGSAKPWLCWLEVFLSASMLFPPIRANNMAKEKENKS